MGGHVIKCTVLEDVAIWQNGLSCMKIYVELNKDTVWKKKGALFVAAAAAAAAAAVAVTFCWRCWQQQQNFEVQVKQEPFFRKGKNAHFSCLK